jgi:hypothetical protein
MAVTWMLNPRIINFYRHFDTDIIRKSLDMVNSFGLHYRHFCSQLITSGEANESVIVIPNVEFEYRPKNCMEIGHTNYEVRNKDEENRLKKAMQEYKIFEVYAPYKIKHDRLFHTSDNTPVTWLKVRMC